MDSQNTTGEFVSYGQLLRYSHIRRTEALNFWREKLEHMAATEPEGFVGLVKAVSREDISLTFEVLRRWGIR